MWAEIHARLDQQRDGTKFIESTFVDLSERRAREELTQQLATIVESSDEAIYSKDLGGVVLTWNLAAERTYGYSAAEAVGRSIADLVFPEDKRPEFAAIMARIKSGLGVPRFETTRRCKDGSTIDASVAVTPVRDASGSVVAVSVCAHDITDRKKAEQAELARIENAHLKELDQTLRDFINAAAHDLNQPLTPMRLALATLKPDLKDLPERGQKMVTMIERNINRMALLVADLLDVARLESGTLAFAMAPVDLGDLLNETDEFFREQTREAGVSLQVSAEQPLPAMADARRIIQVLFNFVGNAIKFTPRGGHITLGGQVKGDFVRVEVKDTGPGLTREQMDLLFLAFSQVHTATRETPKGTGLGVYISKGIVEKHSGRVGVQSDGPGTGSTFWFELPLHGELEARA